MHHILSTTGIRAATPGRLPAWPHAVRAGLRRPVEALLYMRFCGLVDSIWTENKKPSQDSTIMASGMLGDFLFELWTVF